MFSTKCKKFKGEIENYLRNRQNQFESKIDRLFVSLRLKTCLRRTNIINKDGYPSSHLFFVMFMLPLLSICFHNYCDVLLFTFYHKYDIAPPKKEVRYTQKEPVQNSPGDWRGESIKTDDAEVYVTVF